MPIIRKRVNQCFTLSVLFLCTLDKTGTFDQKYFFFFEVIVFDWNCVLLQSILGKLCHVGNNSIAGLSLK